MTVSKASMSCQDCRSCTGICRGGRARVSRSWLCPSPKGVEGLRHQCFLPCGAAIRSTEHKVPFHLPAKGSLLPRAAGGSRRAPQGSVSVLGRQCPLKEALRMRSELWEALQGKLARYSLKLLEIISGKSWNLPEKRLLTKIAKHLRAFPEPSGR